MEAPEKAQDHINCDQQTFKRRMNSAEVRVRHSSPQRSPGSSVEFMDGSRQLWQLFTAQPKRPAGAVRMAWAITAIAEKDMCLLLCV